MMLMTKQELGEVLDVLSAGNVVSVRWSLKILGVRRHQIFDQVLREPKSRKRLEVTEDELVQIQEIPERDLALIRATWGVRDVLWEQHRKLVMNLGYRFVKGRSVPKGRWPDYLSEASVAFMQAMLGYTDRSFSFGAYMGMCVKQYLRRYHCSVLGMHVRSEKLMYAFLEMQQNRMASGLSCGFEEVCGLLKFDKGEVVQVREALRGRVEEGDMKQSLERVIPDCRAKSVDADLIAAIGMVELTLLEHDAFISQTQVRELFGGSHDSLKEVAAEHGVSHELARMAARGAREKIAKRLQTMGYN
jgi:hypothetical protein